MNLERTTLSISIGIALGMASYTTHAALTSSATLDFSLGTAEVISCSNGTTPPCTNTAYNVTDIVGSYFSMELNGDGVVAPFEKFPIGSFNGIHIGTVQAASGSHTGLINGSEQPDIDSPWLFSGSVGMHQTTSPITVNGGSGDNLTLDMSGWNITWNGIPSIPMVQQGAASISCTTGSSCSDGSNYTLDAAFHVTGAGFTTIPYTVHLEGQVSNVPVPAAAWLFGSGLAGLLTFARRRKTGQAPTAATRAVNG